MANPPLPGEILVEIFSRLPLESIARFKSLSKYWLSFLSTREFYNLYLAQKGNLILITPSHSLHLVTPTIDDDADSCEIELPGSWTEVIGSCKGLVLLKNKEDELYLVNPITDTMVKVPDLELAVKKNKSSRVHGFGYDSSSHDYKIVAISFDYDSLAIPNHENLFVDVYSVKSGVWKRVHFPYDGFVPEHDPNISGVFVNGAIHWLIFHRGHDHASKIVAFDLANEVFNEIGGAPCITDSMEKRLIARGEHLCVVSSLGEIGGDVWTMEEYGLKESWNKFTIAKDEYWDEVLRPLCFAGEHQLVLTTRDGILAVYDIIDEAMGAFVIEGVPYYCKAEDDFVENLAAFSG